MKNILQKFTFFFCFAMTFLTSSYGQTFLPSTEAAENLATEMVSLDGILETYSKKDYPIYHEAYAKRQVILNMIGLLKAGVETQEAYEQSIPDLDLKEVSRVTVLRPNAQGKMGSLWIAEEILPIVSI